MLKLVCLPRQTSVGMKQCRFTMNFVEFEQEVEVVHEELSGKRHRFMPTWRSTWQRGV